MIKELTTHGVGFCISFKLLFHLHDGATREKTSNETILDWTSWNIVFFTGHCSNATLITHKSAVTHMAAHILRDEKNKSTLIQ